MCAGKYGGDNRSIFFMLSEKFIICFGLVPGGKDSKIKFRESPSVIFQIQDDIEFYGEVFSKIFFICTEINKGLVNTKPVARKFVQRGYFTRTTGIPVGWQFGHRFTF